LIQALGTTTQGVSPMKFWLTAFLTAALTSCSSMPASSPQTASRAPGVVVLVKYSAQPGQEQKALTEISKLAATVQASEPECGGITVIQDASDKTKITLIERWPSQELFLGSHMQKPHIQAFINSASSFLAGPPDISFWHPVSGA
ncbi:MAG: antibiotic biosynthesis monooxygenase, partial [Lysobacter sp.]|nr:antibiotic biosynthesis monooxygenase [Lysobacter sp.]